MLYQSFVSIKDGECFFDSYISTVSKEDATGILSERWGNRFFYWSVSVIPFERIEYTEYFNLPLTF